MPSRLCLLIHNLKNVKTQTPTYIYIYKNIQMFLETHETQTHSQTSPDVYVEIQISIPEPTQAHVCTHTCTHAQSHSCADTGVSVFTDMQGHEDIYVNTETAHLQVNMCVLNMQLLAFLCSQNHMHICTKAQLSLKHMHKYVHVFTCNTSAYAHHEHI